MDPGTIAAVVELTGKAVSVIWKYYAGVKNAQEDIRRLRNGLEAFQETLQKLKQLTEGTHAARISTSYSLSKTMSRAQGDVRKLYEKLDPGKGKRTWRKIGFKDLTWPLERNEIVQYVADLEKYRSEAALYLQVDTSSRLSAMDMEQQLSKLPFADGAPFNSSSQEHEPHCLADTRVDILEHTQHWSDRSARPIFWLSGLAGTGKSTISRTIARSFFGQGHLAGSFFFRRGRGDLGHAGKFVSTLVRQLTNAQQSLKPFVASVLADNEGILSQGIQNQWEKLVVKPLEDFAKSTSFPGSLKLTFVIDALDECDREDDINLILRLFLQLQSLAAITFQVFLTSRPEIIIRLGFSSMPEIMHQDLDLDAVPRHVVQHDIKALIDSELKRIGNERHLFGWPEPAIIDALVEKSELLFIYAATICRFVGDPADLPEERLAIILHNTSSSGTSLPELDRMYAAILEHSIERNRSGIARNRLVERFQHVIGSYTVLIDTLPAPSLASLLDLQLEQIEISFSPLHSLYYVPSNTEDPLRAIHPSFSEFLLDSSRCPNRSFNVVPETAHSRLVGRCLQILSSLQQDVCQLGHPSTSLLDVPPDKVDHYLPKHVQYACLYVVDHLREIAQSQRREVGLCDGGAAHSFFEHKFLNWVEVMIIMRRLSEAIHMVTELVESLIDASKDTRLHAIVSDARRVLLSNRSIIEEYPLQTYLSPILFTPRASLVRKAYLNFLPQWIAALQNGPSEPGAASQVLETKFYWVRLISFSPNGTSLAGISYESRSSAALQIWDPSTGELRNTSVFQTPNPMAKTMFDIKCHLDFSSDSKILVSGVGDGVIRLWDATTGVPYRTFEYQDIAALDSPWTLWFSSDGEQLVFASSSDKLELRSWSIEKGQFCNKTVIDVTGSYALAASPNGQMLAIGVRELEDGVSIRLWNAKTGLSPKIFEDRTLEWPDLSFSPNGKRLAIQAPPHFILLLDLDATKLEPAISKSVYAAAFSPDSGYLAAACREEIQIWNCRTFDLDRLFRIPVPGFKTIAFSPDGEILAVGVDSTIRLYESNAAEANSSEHIQGKQASVATTISLDNRWIATTPKRGLIEVYDSRTRSIHRKLIGSFDSVYSLRFSYDCTRLAAIAGVSPVQDSGRLLLLWDLTLGSLNSTVRPEKFSIETLDLNYIDLTGPFFSHDGNYIACQNPSEFLIWDLRKKTLKEVSIKPELMENDNMIGSKFSPDGERIYFSMVGSRGHGIRSIDVKDGRLSDLIIGGYYRAFALSPSNRLIVASGFKGLEIWNYSTKELLCNIPFEPEVQLEFSDTGEVIKTAYGWIKFQESTSTETKAHLSLPGWIVRNGWLEWKGQKVLRLPSDFRRPQACAGSTFIWAYQGRAVYLDLNEAGPTFTDK